MNFWQISTWAYLYTTVGKWTIRLEYYNTAYGTSYQKDFFNSCSFTRLVLRNAPHLYLVLERKKKALMLISPNFTLTELSNSHFKGLSYSMYYKLMMYYKPTPLFSSKFLYRYRTLIYGIFVYKLSTYNYTCFGTIMYFLPNQQTARSPMECHILHGCTKGGIWNNFQYHIVVYFVLVIHWQQYNNLNSENLGEKNNVDSYMYAWHILSNRR